MGYFLRRCLSTIYYSCSKKDDLQLRDFTRRHSATTSCPKMSKKKCEKNGEFLRGYHRTGKGVDVEALKAEIGEKFHFFRPKSRFLAQKRSVLGHVFRKSLFCVEICNYKVKILLLRKQLFSFQVKIS